jgi:hypothetical protein
MNLLQITTITVADDAACYQRPCNRAFATADHTHDGSTPHASQRCRDAAVNI